MVESVGIRKAKMSLVSTLAHAVLAGAFIAFGGMLFTLVMTGSELGFGPERWLGGIAFRSGSFWW